MHEKHSFRPVVKRYASVFRGAWRRYSVPVIHIMVVTALIFSLIGSFAPQPPSGYAATPTPTQKAAKPKSEAWHPAGPHAMITPEFDEGPVGHRFIQNVELMNVPLIYGAEFHVKFDPSKLQVVDKDPVKPGVQIVNGPFLSPYDPAAIIQSVDNVAGFVNWAATLLNPQPPVSGGGILAGIEFQAIATGWTSVHFDNPVPYQPPVKVAEYLPGPPPSTRPLKLDGLFGSIKKIYPPAPRLEMPWVPVGPFQEVTVPVFYVGDTPPSFFDIFVDFDRTKLKAERGNAETVVIDNAAGRVRLSGRPGYEPLPTLTPMPTYTPGGTPLPTWTPPHQFIQQIVFTRWVPAAAIPGNYEIYKMNDDGTGQVNISNNPYDDMVPHTDAMGQIVFKSYRDGNPEIYRMAPDGTLQTRMTNNPADDFWPNISQDGTRIVFSSKRDNPNEDIYIMPNVPLAAPTRLTGAGPTGPGNTEPHFSYAGDKIVFTSFRDGPIPEIYMMDSNGANQTRLTNNQFDDHHPTFTPDFKILFTSNRADGVNFDLYIMDPVPNAPAARLTKDPAVDDFGRMKPTMTKIAFTSYRTANDEIFKMDPAGADPPAPQNLSNYALRDFHPDWILQPIIQPTPTLTPPPNITPWPTPTIWEPPPTPWPTPTPSPTPWQTPPPTMTPQPTATGTPKNILTGISSTFTVDPVTGQIILTVTILNPPYSDPSPFIGFEVIDPVTGEVINVFTFGGPMPTGVPLRFPVNLPPGPLMPNMLILHWLGQGGQNLGNSTSTFVQPTGPQSKPAAKPASQPLAAPKAWSAPYNISNSSGTSENAGSATFKDPNNNVHLVYRDNTPGNYDIYYTVLLYGAPFWFAPVNISASSGNSTAARVQATASGDVHAVWQDNSAGNYNIYYALKPLGGPWGAPLNMTSGLAGDHTNPRINLYYGGAGTEAFVVWEGGTAGSTDILYKRRDAAGIWSGLVNISSSAGNSMDPFLFRDALNNLNLAYSDNTGGADYDVYYASLPLGGFWGAPVNISSSNGVTSRKPQVRSDSAGNAYVMWEENPGGQWEIFYNAKPPAGPWPAPINVSNRPAPNDDTYFQFQVGSGGGVRAVWQSGATPDIWYAHKPGGGVWTVPVNISNTAGYSFHPRLARDSSDGLHVTYHDMTPGNYDIYYQYLPSGGVWTPPTNVSANAGTSINTSLQVDPSKVHIIWQDNTNLTNPDIFYAWEENPPPPPPTPTPGPSPVATPTPGPTPSPAPSPTPAGTPIATPTPQPFQQYYWLGNITFTAIGWHCTGSGLNIIINQFDPPQPITLNILNGFIKINEGPHRQSVVFHSLRDGNPELYMMEDFPGAPVTRLTTNTVPDRFPHTAPYQGRIVFESERGGNTDVYLRNPDGTEVRLTTAAAADTMPNLSYDGRRAVFVRDNDVWIMEPAPGATETNMTAHAAVDTDPHLNWDATRFVFVSDRDGNQEIWVRDTALGGTATQLTFTASPVVNKHPSFTPDGRVLFVSNRDPANLTAATINDNIYIMNGDGTGVTRLTNVTYTGAPNTFVNNHPRMKPNSKRIAFTSTRDGNTDIYMMNPDGTGEVRLTDVPAEDAHPDWLIGPPDIGPHQTPTPQPTYTPPPGGTLTPSPTPGAAATATPSPTPAATPSPSPSPSPTPTPVPATKVEAGTKVFAAGSTGNTVPVWVKNIVDPEGLGAYEVRIEHDPAKMTVTNILGGDAPFDAAPSKNLSTPGVVLMSALQFAMNPGPAGDVLIANLVVNAIGAPGQVSPLTVVLTAVSVKDADGNNIPAAPIHGSVKIFAADFTAVPDKGVAPLWVQFTDTSNGPTTAWLWNFGDNSGSTQQNPGHQYQQGGNYTATLTATLNSSGNPTHAKSALIQVIEPRFSASPVAGNAPLLVAFTDETRGTVNSWSWSFGDGTGSSSQNPTKTYNDVGTYTVRLTVSGPAGSASLTRESLINVTRVQHVPGFGQYQSSPDGIAWLDINVNRIFNPSTGQDVEAPGGIGAYEFVLTYPGGASGNAINIGAIRTVDPFSATAGPVPPSSTGAMTIAGLQTSGAPQAPATLVRVAPRIIGSALVSHNLVMTFNTLSDVATGANIPADGPRTYVLQRGDARKDGIVDMSDALFIAQFRVGIRLQGDTTLLTHIVNGASVQLEATNTGEKATMNDALFIAQYRVNLRDASFNWIAG